MHKLLHKRITPKTALRDGRLVNWTVVVRVAGRALMGVRRAVPVARGRVRRRVPGAVRAVVLPGVRVVRVVLVVAPAGARVNVAGARGRAHRAVRDVLAALGRSRRQHGYQP